MIHFFEHAVVLGTAEIFAFDASKLGERTWEWMRSNAASPGQFLLRLAPDAAIDAYTSHHAEPLRILAPLPLLHVEYNGLNTPGYPIGSPFRFTLTIKTC
jgi:hypothetical protein